MADKLPPLPKGLTIVDDKLPPLPKGLTVVEEKKNRIQNAPPTGTQTSKSGSLPFLPQVSTKIPSVLTPKGQVGYQEQVKNYVPPKEVKLPKDETPDFFESVKNSLSNIGTGVQQFIPNTTIALSETLQGLLGKDLGSDFYRNIVGAANNPELDRQIAYAKLAELEPQFKKTRGLIESAEKFDVVGLAAATVDAMSSLVRTAITSVPTAGIGLASDMVGGSIASYNKEKAKSKGISVDELYKRGENEFAIPAAIGAIGTGLEGIGLKGTIGLINKKLTGSIAKKFATTFVDVNKEGLTEFTQTGLDAANNALAQGKSATEATSIAVDEMFSKKGLESYLMGSVGSAGAAGLGRVAKGMLPSNKKTVTEATQKISEMESELNNPNLSPATQEFISQNIRENVSVIADAIESDADKIEGLSDEQKFTINSVNEVINSYEEVLSDPNASEQTKNLAQERIDKLDLEIDNILEGKKVSPETESIIQPIPKPTFDTEEQLIEEGKTAEEEYKKTGDQVTYEQKIKELEEREKNLVPAPKDAEIGKPEEVVEVEPIRQLGTGANVYFETEKYRVNDTLKNGKVLLNIQSQTSEIPIANIEFDNANDAVIIAQELNNKFPDGVPDAILIDKYIEQLKNDLLVTQPKQDAIQVETAGQVPVLTEAPVGEEVEQGKPQPEAEVVTEEGGKAEEVARLRAKEQAELKVAIPNADQYLTDGKVDRAKITDAKDLKKFDDIYDKYDRLITPLLPKKEAKVEEPLKNVESTTKALEDKAKESPKLVGEVSRNVFPDAGYHIGELKSKSDEINESYYGENPWTGYYFISDPNKVVQGGSRKGNTKAFRIVNFSDYKLLKFEDANVYFGTKRAIKKLANDLLDGKDTIESINKLLSDNNVSPSLKSKIKQYDENESSKIDIERDIYKLEQARNKAKSNRDYDAFEIEINKLKEQLKDIPKVDLSNTLQKIVESYKNKRSTEEFSERLETSILKNFGYEGIDVRGLKEYKGSASPDTFSEGSVIFDLKPNTAISLSEAYHKAKADGSNPELVKSVEDLLGKTTEVTPAKPKAEPKLKSKVATRLLFKKAVDLFYDISGTEGSAKKSRLAGDRRRFMEQNPSIKYIDDNWDSISKQLEAKGLLTKSKGCP